MKLFVTGGTGFIGSHFIRAALAAGHQVTAICRTPLRGEAFENESARISWIERALACITEEDLSGHDVLVHLASYGVSPKKCTWESAFQINVVDGIHLIHKAANAKIPRILLAGSCVEYGKSAEHYEQIPPNAPLAPLGAYAASKAALSLAANSLCRELGIELAILRFFTVFGEGQFEGNFWPALRKAALNGMDFAMSSGEQFCDFIPIEEAVAAAIRALAIPISAEEPLVANIGSGKPQTLRAFAESWWMEWSAAGMLIIGAKDYRPTDVMRYVPEVCKSLCNP